MHGTNGPFTIHYLYVPPALSKQQINETLTLMTNSTPGTDLIFFHLTDLHLVDQEDQLVNGRSPFAKLSALLARLHAVEVKPAFILITGDLVNNGQPEEYRQFCRILPRLAEFDVPVLMALGNHDERPPFRQVVLQEDASTEPYYYSKVIDGLNLLILDSHVPGQVHGYIDETQLAWLDTELAKPMPRGHLIALHHPPVPVTVKRLDRIGLTNADALAAIVRRHEHVLGVLSGHIHYSHVAPFANTISVTTPAVFYTIDPGVQENLRLLDGSGFSIGTICNNQLMMNTIMLGGEQQELSYRVSTDDELAKT